MQIAVAGEEVPVRARARCQRVPDERPVGSGQPVEVGDDGRLRTWHLPLAYNLEPIWP